MKTEIIRNENDEPELLVTQIPDDNIDDLLDFVSRIYFHGADAIINNADDKLIVKIKPK